MQNTSNQVLRINNQPSIIYKSTRKLLWLNLPQLTPIYKYYTKSNYIKSMGIGSLLVIDKNCINFLTVNLPPLALNVFKQQFMNWQPTGGVCLTNILILYDKHTINFYERGQNLKKTWTIQVMQQITQINASPLQKVIGMTVKQKTNTIFLWNLYDISNKPFQQVTWQFYTKDMLVIMTSKQLQVYYPQDGHYNLQFFIQTAHTGIDFCFMDRPKTNQHSGRRTVYPVAVLSAHGKLYIYQLYDIDKRIKTSIANIIATLQVEQSTKRIICGYEKHSQIILCAQTENGKPFCMTLNPQFVPKKKWMFLPQLLTQNNKLIQYCKQIICTQDSSTNQKQQPIKIYKLYKIVGKDQFQYIQQYQCNNYGILGGYNFFAFQKESINIYVKAQNFQIDKKVTIQNVKVPANLFLLEQKNNIAYFISGIKIYKLDITNKIFKAAGFTIKNQKFKLVQVRNQTRSILYEMNGEYMLMEYQTPQNPQKQTQKLAVKSIKSSQNRIISLRNNRWAQLKIDKIIIGEGIKILVQFDLAKFFKLLTQDNILLQYKVYWTTHDGILLVIQNYIFVLQLIQSTDGYAINPIKRSLGFLHCRLDPDVGEIQIMDARSIVVREGSRVMKLGSKLGNYISEDPYSLPDTVLRRQLLMRKMYPPHHPKIVQYLIQLGCFGLLGKMFENLWDWLQEKGTMSQLYDKIGLQFYQNSQNNKIVDEKSTQFMKQFSNDLDEQQKESTLKKLCEYILENPHSLYLQQNGSLILQSQIQALIFKQQNSRSVDPYSSVVLTQFKTYQTKNQSFKSMHIAYMLHSINKQQAVGFLRQQKPQIDWDWIKKYSIVMWYDVKTQIKTWAEEIGANLFKINKQPMDCLFWYTIAGKKTVLIQLFKKYTFNSSEHEGIFKFLQRDFSQPKNQNAAVKNAYVLIDKKRYLHALAFFIYGQKIDQAISLCLSKLKDLNLAFLICNVTQDTINRQKLIDNLLKQGDVWSKHIAYFYRNQHIDSYNCLFQQQNIQILNAWQLQPKLTCFHPSLKQFAEMIQKSIPVKRQLQQQTMKKNQPDPNDIFQSFYGNQEQTHVQQVHVQEKRLQPNYQYINKQSVKYFIRNNCPTLALMLDQTNHRARRAYDLCKFMLTKQVNNTVIQLIEQMQDYQSIINSKLKQGVSIKPVLQQFATKYKQVLSNFTFSSISTPDKSKIGELMHFSYLAERFINKIQRKQIVEEQSIEYSYKNIGSLLEIGKMLLILKLEIYDKIQQFAGQFLNYIAESKVKALNSEQQVSFWQQIKAHYDKTPQIKKNKRQNLYDSFQQSLYKLTFKKTQFTQQNTTFKLAIQNCIHIYVAKLTLDIAIKLLNQNNTIVNLDASNILQKIQRKISSILLKWSEQKTQDQLQRQCNIMLAQGVVSKLKLHYLPPYLQNNFQPLCRALIALKNKIKKGYPQRDTGKTVGKERIQKNQVIQIFRNKQDAPRSFSINKNDGFGMQIAMLTKKGIKKLQICQSLVNRNRSQDGISLIHDDTYYSIDNQFNFNTMFDISHPLLVQKYIHNVIQNRKQYDGVGIIKGSTKRTTPQYLKSLDPVPYLQMSQINCIQCHHFLPIYMLGGKSYIQLCTFNTNKNYNRIKCPSLGDIVKIRSYEQRVCALDSNGNLGCYSFDSKISGTCVFSLKKTNVIDFCQMTPTTYGICTNSSIQVLDTLLHPKRQVVFKTSTNQAPIAVDYFNRTKLAICRRNDMLVYDIRMDIQEQNRDLGGKGKCMVSNFKNKILVGKMDNRVRVMDMSSTGAENDYDIKCISGFRGDGVVDKAMIEDIQVMGKLAIALNSQGILTMFSIE